MTKILKNDELFDYLNKKEFDKVLGCQIDIYSPEIEYNTYMGFVGRKPYWDYNHDDKCVVTFDENGIVLDVG